MTAILGRITPLRFFSLYRPSADPKAPVLVPQENTSTTSDALPPVNAELMLALSLHNDLGTRIQALKAQTEASDARRASQVQRIIDLERRLHKLTASHESLSAEHEALASEHEALKKTNRILKAEQAGLEETCNSLRRELRGSATSSSSVYATPIEVPRTPPTTPPRRRVPNEDDVPTPQPHRGADFRRKPKPDEGSVALSSDECSEREYSESDYVDSEVSDIEYTASSSEASTEPNDDGFIINDYDSEYENADYEESDIGDSQVRKTTVNLEASREMSSRQQASDFKEQDPPESVLSMGSMVAGLPEVENLTSTPLPRPVPSPVVTCGPSTNVWRLEFRHAVNIPKVGRSGKKTGACVFSGYNLLADAVSGWGSGGKHPMPEVISLGYKVAEECKFKFRPYGYCDGNESGNYYASHAEAQLLTFLVIHMFPTEYQSHVCEQGDAHFCKSWRQPNAKKKITIWVSRDPCQVCLNYCEKINLKYRLQIVLKAATAAPDV
jgi:hypothetical protein